jgi:predicted HTH domain antitoxin
MGVEITDEVLVAARMTEDELRQEVAVMLFARERMTLAQAARFAGQDLGRFQHLLASRDITIHYDVADFEADLQTLREMGRL